MTVEYRFPTVFTRPTIPPVVITPISGRTPASLAEDPRWVLDDPPAARWFASACEYTWTRDPFDRLLAAHAQVRGWRLATADQVLLDRLSAES